MNINKIASNLRNDYIEENCSASINAYESLPTKKRYSQYEELTELIDEDIEE